MSFDSLATEIATLGARGLRRVRRVIESPASTHVTVDGREFLSFCSNDYLGLASDPRLASAACEGVRLYGVGAGASHLISGHFTAHQSLEARLAQFVGLPRALLFSSGYMANVGIVTALVGRDDAVLADRLNHASLNDAALLSRATFRRYAHGDLHALERLLRATPARRKLVVSDAVFSMDGDIAPVAELLRLCEQYDAWLLLDDAHGFGVLGKTGAGVLQHFGIASDRIVYMATLGKAAGVSGAFVAGKSDMIETMIQRARPYIYTTASPPMLAHALLTSLEIIAAESALRSHLVHLVDRLKRALHGLPWRLAVSSTAIQPLMVGNSSEALRVSAALVDKGLLVPAIRPPTVPTDTARLRISLSAAHTLENIDRLAHALRELGAAS